MKETTVRLSAGLLVVALVLAACGSVTEDAMSGNANNVEGPVYDGGEVGYPGTDPESPPTTVAGATGTSEGFYRAAGGKVDLTPVALTTSDFGRDIIFTGDLTVAVDDVDSAGQEAILTIQGLGGYLFGQSSQGAPNAISVLVFKVTPTDFQTALSQLGALGDVRSQDVSASDVTERIVDLESQIETTEASVVRLRALLSDAADIKTIVELENELLGRETQLETLRGQLRTLQNQVALATIVLTLTEAEANPALSVEVTAYSGHDDGAGCPGDPEVSVEQETQATVCFEILNIGDTILTDFELKDPVLDIDTGDLITVFGDPGTTLEPGESIVLAAEVDVARTVRTRTTVNAQPVDEDGNVLTGRSVTQTTSMVVHAVDPGGIPTFTEGLATSWDWLLRAGQWVLLAVGALVPFLWIPVIAWLVWKMRRPRRADTQPAPEPSSGV
jgi:hypothetical protein